MNTHTFLILICPLVLAVTACAPKAAVERDQAMVDELINKNRDQIEQCYSAVKEKNPKLPAGTLVVRAEHNPDGSISNVRKIKSFVGASPVFDCIAGLMEDWKTKRPYTRGPVELQWSFQN